MTHKGVILIEPIEDLVSRIREINKNGPTLIEGAGSGKYGLALERELGIEKNSSKKPDFRGIEIKTKATSKLQTLFSRTPSEYLSCGDRLGTLRKYGYENKDGRTQLYTSVNHDGDSLGFRIVVLAGQVILKRGPESVLSYENTRLTKALKSKHSESAFVTVKPVNHNTTYYYPTLQHCREPSFEKFLILLRSSKIYLDLTLSVKNGVAKDHGFLWRIPSDELPNLFEHIEEYALM